MIGHHIQSGKINKVLVSGFRGSPSRFAFVVLASHSGLTVLSSRFWLRGSGFTIPVAIVLAPQSWLDGSGSRFRLHRSGLESSRSASTDFMFLTVAVLELLPCLRDSSFTVVKLTSSALIVLALRFPHPWFWLHSSRGHCSEFGVLNS